MKIKRVFFYRVVAYDAIRTKIPRDMLRFDSAFVSVKHPGFVAFPVFSVPKFGDYGGKVTPERWHSFSVVLEARHLSDIEVGKNGLNLNNHGWHTYRHQSLFHDEGHKVPVDHGSLVRVELSAYLDAKDTTDL